MIDQLLNPTSPRNEIAEGVSFGRYRRGIGMNPSTICAGFRRQGAISMLHLKHAWDVPRADKPAFIFGRAVHTALFEPRKMESRYGCWEGVRRGSEYKQAVADAFLNGKELLTEQELHQALICAKRVASDPVIQPYISSGKAEVVAYWMEGPIQCRGRMDWINGDPPALLDLKTSRDVSEAAFGRDFVSYHYDVKMGLYQRALLKLTGIRYPVLIPCVENEAPYDTTLVPIPDSVLEKGVEKAMNVLNRLPECIETGIWPGVANGEEYHLTLPAFYEQDELVEWQDDD